MAKDEKDLEGDDEAGGGGKKKLIIIIGAAVLLLLAGGGAAMFLLGGSDETGDDQAKAEEQAPVVLPDPIYYKFKPQFVVSLPPGQRARMLQISLQVMARQQPVIDYVDHNSPMLRHYLFNLFSTVDAASLYGREGREALAQSVKDDLNGILAEKGVEGGVEAVYFDELVLQ